jgi:hypothetical protein
MLLISKNTTVQSGAHAYLIVADIRCSNSTAIDLFNTVPVSRVHGMPYTASNACTVSSDVAQHDFIHIRISSLCVWVHTHACHTCTYASFRLKHISLSLAPAYNKHSLRDDRVMDMCSVQTSLTCCIIIAITGTSHSMIQNVIIAAHRSCLTAIAAVSSVVTRCTKLTSLYQMHVTR